MMRSKNERLATRRSFLAAAALPLALGLLPAARAQPRGAAPLRMALVIGNSRYASAPLVNPPNDARLVSTAMECLGFKVDRHLDVNQAGMLGTVKAWLDSAAKAEVRMVYYSGHGAQYRGRNYLVPVDAALQSEDDLPAAAFDVGVLTERLSRFGAGVNIVVLDACRSIPMNQASPGARRLKGPPTPWTPGFVPAKAPRGTLIAYSTSPGAVAADDPQMTSSVYTRSFVEQLMVKGLPVETVFKRTREAVLQASQGTQMPMESSSLVGEYFFHPHHAGTCPWPMR
jgi:uncharacterized caspase-like protein